jgi:DNA-binding LacI/PurR family transcriptional regulator
MRIPKEALGRLAFMTLEEMLACSRPSGFERTVDTELIIRGSTGPAHEPTAKASVDSNATEEGFR